MTTATDTTQALPAEVTVPAAMLIELAAAVTGAGDALEFLDGNNTDLAEYFADFAHDVMVDVFGWDPTTEDDEAWATFPARLAIETRADEIEADALDLTEDPRERASNLRLYARQRREAETLDVMFPGVGG